jgi:hypothetical protein
MDTKKVLIVVDFYVPHARHVMMEFKMETRQMLIVVDPCANLVLAQHVALILIVMDGSIAR